MAKKRGKRANHEGTLYQRKDGRWYAQITMPDGARKGFYGNSEAEALSRKQDALASLAKGLPLYNEKQTLGAYLSEWIQSVSNVRASSWARYETIVRVHLLPSSLSKIPLIQLTRKHILAFYKQKQQEGLSSTTVSHFHVVLSRALREATEDHLIPYNVCYRLKAPQPSEKEMLYLSREQSEQFLTIARSHRLFALFALALITGMRQGELLGLRWKDVSLDGPKPCLHVRVQAQVVRERGQYSLALVALKTRRSTRRIDLGPLIVQALRAHKARQELEKRIAGDAWQQLALVFPTRQGGIANPSGLYKAFQRLAKQAGLPEGLHFHSLRHTAITLALEEGQDAKTVAEMVGDTVATILRDYLHVTPKMKQSLASTMDALLGVANGPLQYSLQSNQESYADER